MGKQIGKHEIASIRNMSANRQSQFLAIFLRVLEITAAACVNPDGEHSNAFADCGMEQNYASRDRANTCPGGRLIGTVSVITYHVLPIVSTCC